MKYFDMNIETYEDILRAVHNYNDGIACDVAFQEGVCDIDFDDFVDNYADDCVRQFKAEREAGVEICTTEGLIHGHFVGSVEYAIAGDPVNGFETDRMLAFATDNGQIVGAFENVAGWDLYNLKQLGGVIHWDEYPMDWDVVWTRPESIKRPAAPKEPTLSDFVDNPHRTDAGDFLYVVKYGKGYEAYVGHNRKTAAKHMKTLRLSGNDCRVEVYPVHKQDEYDSLPF